MNLWGTFRRADQLSAAAGRRAPLLFRKLARDSALCSKVCLPVPFSVCLLSDDSLSPVSQVCSNLAARTPICDASFSVQLPKSRQICRNLSKLHITGVRAGARGLASGPQQLQSYLARRQEQYYEQRLQAALQVCCCPCLA